MKIPCNKRYYISKFPIALILFSAGNALINAQDIDIKKDTVISVLGKEKVPGILPIIDNKIKKSESFRTVCVASIKSDQIPLYILDGEIISEKTMRMMDSNSIERVDVLKGTSATALYGVNANDGAVIITSKKQMMSPKSKISK